MRLLRRITIAALTAAGSTGVFAHGSHPAPDTPAHHDQLHLLLDVAAGNAWLLAALAAGAALGGAWLLGRRGEARARH